MKSSGNVVEFLQDGAQVYPPMLQAIAGAKAEIQLESYIFAPDSVGWAFAEALAQAAKRGVVVDVMVDAWGSFALSQSGIPKLFHQAGVHFVEFNPVSLFHPWRSLTRNHRKTLVIDGAVAFLGGLNITADHVAPPEGQGWHDAAVKIAGPAAFDVQTVFFREWDRLIRGGLNRARRHPRARSNQGQPPGGECEVLSNRAFSDRLNIRRRYLHSIAQATRSIVLANAYFLPDFRIRRALRLAKKRGVRVALLLPHAIDIPLLKLAQTGFFPRFFRWGLEIFEWPGPMLHHKLALFDDHTLVIGSYNLDRRSLRRNLELSVWLKHSEAVDAAVVALQHDLDVSTVRHAAEFENLSLWRRLAVGFAFLLREQF